MNFIIGMPEIIIICFFFLVVAPVTLIILALIPPKTANKGTFLAILIGPLAYIYVDKWGKALALFVIGWLTAGIIHLIIWPYSIFNIRTEVRKYNEDMQIRSEALRGIEAHK